MLFCGILSDKTTTTEAGNGITDGAATSVEEARRRFLPPVKLDAPTPEGVYSVKDIAGAQELHALGRQIDSSAKECEVRMMYRCGLAGCSVLPFVSMLRQPTDVPVSKEYKKSESLVCIG